MAVPYGQLYDYSRLTSIAATQSDADVVRKARQQLTMLMYEDTHEAKGGDFLFVIDNAKDYTSLNDFKSADARNLFKTWQDAVVAYKKDAARLENLREDYISLPASRKASLAAEILRLEKKLDDDYYSLQSLEYKVRRLELEKLTNTK